MSSFLLRLLGLLVFYDAMFQIDATIVWDHWVLMPWALLDAAAGLVLVVNK